MLADGPLVQLDTILHEVIERHDIAPDRVVLGGLQMGYLRRPAPLRPGRGAVLGSMRRELGGTPVQAADRYRRNSVLTQEDTLGGNAFLLARTAVRIYVEPDIAWHMRVAGDDFLSSNLADAAGLIQLLLRHGNAHAELRTPAGRAVLPDGQPSSHAWNIIEEDELVEWIMAMVESPVPAVAGSEGTR